MTITKQDRGELLKRMNQLKPEARIEHIAKLRSKKGFAFQVAVLEGIHRELLIIESNRTDETLNPKHNKSKPDESRVAFQLPEGWTPGKVGLATVLGGGAAVVGYNIIPIFISVITAVMAAAFYVLTAVVVGGVCFFFLWSILTEGVASMRANRRQPEGNGNRSITINIGDLNNGDNYTKH